MNRIERATERRLNTLVLGPPGSGKTTILRMLEWRGLTERRTARDELVYVDLAPASTAMEALNLILAALAGDARRHPASANVAVPEDNPAVGASSRLLAVVRRLADYPARTILVDSPPGGGESHLLFGRLRDELWLLPHHWVVAADTALRAELSRPPADAFFDVRVELVPLPTDARRALLERRLDGDIEVDVKAMSSETDGFPRSLVTLAREVAMVDGGAQDVIARRRGHEERIAALPPASRRVAQYLEVNGPTSASDQALLTSLDMSSQRARLVLRSLENEGLARSFSDHRETTGRPRKLYQLLDTG